MPEDQNNQSPTDDFDFASRLPEYVRQAMSSLENAEINGRIAEKYQLEEEEIPLMVNVIARVVLKEISLMDFPRALKDALNLDVETTKAMALDIAIRQFLPLKNHLGDVENLIRKLGGEVPSYAEASADAKALADKSEGKPPFAQSIKTPPPPPPAFLRKDLRTILKDNKETEEQLITSQPIRIEGFNGLVRPSLKNWLSDYIRLEGVGPHSLMVLTNYLYNSANGKILNPKERKLLGKILQSYSENTSLPVSEKTGLIVLEGLEKETAGASPLPPTPLPPKTPLITPATPVAAEQSAPQNPEQPSAPTDQPSRKNAEEKPLRQQTPVPPVFLTQSPLKQDSPAPERTYPKPTFSPAQSPSEALREGGPTPSPAPLQNQSADWRTKESSPPPPTKQESYLEPINDLESGSPLPKTETRPGQPGAQPRLDGNIIDLKNFRQ